METSNIRIGLSDMKAYGNETALSTTVVVSIMDPQ